jgi:hypothetical protein
LDLQTVRVREQKDKFVSPIARADVSLPHRACEPADHRLQHLVSNQISPLIVDLLEIIQIQDGNGKRFPGTLSPLCISAGETIVTDPAVTTL